ncbi:MAG: hypothetical protein ACP5D2_02395, partial [Candidatus Nanoarchaeia archaeon]
PIFNTDDTAVSSYLLNYSIGPGSQKVSSLEISIDSPLNSTYHISEILLNISVSGGNPINLTWYNWNGTNITYISPINITFNEGQNNLTAWVNDSEGNLNFTSVFFTIDTFAPTLTIYEPDGEYTSGVNIPLNFSVSKTPEACWYSLNGDTNTSIPNCNITNNHILFNGSIEGPNTIIVYANSSAGLVEFSSKNFSINLQNNTLLIFPVEQEWETDEAVTLEGFCKFTNGTTCPENISCRFTVYYPNGSLLGENLFADYSAGGLYSYSIGYTNFTNNIPGPYSSAMACYDGFNQEAAFTWKVITEENASVYLYFLLFFSVIMLMVIGEWKDNWVFMFFASCLLLVVGIWIFVNGLPGLTLSYFSSGHEDAWISWISFILIFIGIVYMFRSVYDKLIGGLKI